jgi:hypothetical protein
MTQLEKLGKKRTILISISVLLVSLHTIYYYQSILPEIDVRKLVQQMIRFAFTVLLLYHVYKGKNWAKIVMIILFSLGSLIGIVSLFLLEQDIVLKIPLLVMIIVYSLSVYHFSSKSYKAFAKYQNIKNNSNIDAYESSSNYGK